MTTTDHSTLPTNFEAKSYYLRSSNLSRDAFEEKFTTTNTNFAKGIMELEAINVPLGGKDELVDVAVYLTDSRGKVHFVKKDAVPIQPANR